MPEQSDYDQTEQVADLILRHAHPGEVLHVFDDVWMTCACGLRIDIRRDDAGRAQLGEGNRAWRRHLADEILAVVTGPEQSEMVRALRALADENEGWEWSAPVGPGNASYANGYENGRRAVGAELRDLIAAVDLLGALQRSVDAAKADRVTRPADGEGA